MVLVPVWGEVALFGDQFFVHGQRRVLHSSLLSETLIWMKVNVADFPVILHSKFQLEGKKWHVNFNWKGKNGINSVIDHSKVKIMPCMLRSACRGKGDNSYLY